MYNQEKVPKVLLIKSKVALYKTCSHDEPRNEKKVMIIYIKDL